MRFDEGGILDRLAIRELIENWVLWRDTGEWDRLTDLWHTDGRMVATWIEAPARVFIARSKAAFEAGVMALHTLGGTAIDIRGDRAIAQTKMQLVQRAFVHDILVDVTCYGRFWDAIEKEGGEWKLLLRQPIYELDRLSPVSGAAVPQLDPDLLARFPEGYRHLAYLQTQAGMNVSPDRPCHNSVELGRIVEGGRRWIAGGGRSDLSPAFTE